MAIKKILLFIDWFAPGYKAGGPIRSAVNFATHMQHEYEVYVVSSDRDLDSSTPYNNVVPDAWSSFKERVKVLYCSPGNMSRSRIDKIIDEVAPDYIYLNGMFSKSFTIYPLLSNRKAKWRYKVVLLPHGMLKDSALQFKATKKKIFLAVFKLLGFHKHITFQATDETEYKDVKQKLGEGVHVILAPNLPDAIPPYRESIAKSKGALKMIFIGRVHPIKNLDFLLKCLPGLQGNVELTVIGSEEDKAFDKACREMVNTFPENISVDFLGERAHDELPAIMAAHHLFSLPTKGENFGYAIFEAMAVGKPVLISDQTPWKGLAAKKAGWDLPLDKPAQFVNALQQAIDFDQVEYQQWSKGAWQYVKDAIRIEDLRIIYQKLFN